MRLNQIVAVAIGLYIPSLLANWVQAAEKPNVLLICVDDLKPNIGCFGDGLAKTPNIDRLANRGVVFLNSFANQAVCAPSRNSLMTGLRPDQIGIYDLSTWFRYGAPNAVTFSQCFMNNGYRAESLGKIFHRGHGNVIDPASWSTHFWTPPGRDPAAVTTGGPKPPADATVLKNGNNSPWGWPDVPDSEFHDGKLAKYATERLNALASGKDPFFLGVGFVKPHLPFNVPKQYWDLFDVRKLPVFPTDAALPKGAPAFTGHNSGELRTYSDIQESGPLTEEQARTMVHGYYAATAFVDAQIGYVLDTMDRLDLWKNTIVILWGDHGWHLGDHGLWCKHTNYEQAAHNPLIIVAPGKTSGGWTKSLTQSVDVYPTVCALAGINPPAGLAGRSLVPVLENVSVSVQDAVFHVYPRGIKEIKESKEVKQGQSGGEAGATPGKAGAEVKKEIMLGRAVRTARYRYIEWRSFTDATVKGRELYDYQTDPGETENLADRAELSAVIDDLSSRLAALGPARKPVEKNASLIEGKDMH